MKKLFLLSAVAVAALFTSCQDEDIQSPEWKESPLAGSVYEYTDSTYKESLIFYPNTTEYQFAYEQTPITGGGGYSTAGIRYEFAYPYIFFDGTYEPRMDIKKIKFIGSSDLEITRKDGRVVIFKGGRGWNHDEMDNTYTDFVDE